MPRSTTRNRSGSKASKVPSFQKRNSHTPSSSQTRGQPQPQPQQTSSFGEAVKSGIGLGIGMEAVRGVAGALSGSSYQQQHQEPQHQEFTGINDNTKSICDTYHSDLLKCLKNDKINCETLFLQYKDCLMNQLS